MRDIQNKFLGSMVGSALGDSIGELAFRCQSKERLLGQLERLEKFIYTDDTAMAIGIAETIVKKGDLNQQELGERFKYNFRKEPWRGYGPGPPLIFSMAERLGLSCVEAAKTLFGGKGSFGNGAAMRVAPVGLFYHNSPHLYEKTSISATVTHAHPLGIDGAAIQARAVSLAVSLDPKETFKIDTFIYDLIEFAKTSEMKNKIRLIQRLLTVQTPSLEAAKELGRSVAVHESLPFALYSFLNHPHSFEDCLYCAIMNGGDRDTLGAMACAVSGAYLGIATIPQGWKQKLENRLYIEELASKLSEIKGGPDE